VAEGGWGLGAPPDWGVSGAALPGSDEEIQFRTEFRMSPNFNEFDGLTDGEGDVIEVEAGDVIEGDAIEVPQPSTLNPHP